MQKQWTLVLAVLVMGSSQAHDLGVSYDPAADMFPDPSDVQAAIDRAGDHPNGRILNLATSQSASPIRAVEYVLPGLSLDERVVTFIMTQQHGNEPAGTPAAMQLFDRIAAGEFDDVLSNQVLIVMPQSNPDGSAANRRTAEDGTDINRDHVALVTPEARAIHQIMNLYDVHVAFDHHEYGGTGVGYPSPVRTYDWDLTTMYPNHGNVREPTRQMAERMNYEHIYPFVQGRGYTIGDYGQQGVGVSGGPTGDVFVPTVATAGGPDPGILRNNFGLNNVVGLLVESYIAPAENPLHSFERRVDSHLAVMEAVLHFSHQEADELKQTKRASERLNRQSPPTTYMEGELTASLPAAFLVTDDVEATFAAHDLPPGTPHPAGAGLVWNMDMNRAGLLAALLEPTSSRNVADGSPTAPVDDSALQHHRDFAGPGQPQPQQPADESVESPGASLALFVLGLALLALRRK